MKHKLTLIDGPDYLHIVMSGKLDESNLIRSNKDIKAILLESHHDKILFDVRELELDTSVIDDYFQASSLANDLAKMRHKIAHLTTTEKLDADNFVETIISNRGVHIQNFLGKQDAVDWLLTEPVT